MGKKSGSGMNNQDHICKSLETIFWGKILKFFDADPESGILDGKNSLPGSGMENSQIRGPGSGKTSRIRNTGRWSSLLTGDGEGVGEEQNNTTSWSIN
jgi:hypothetical protein